MPTDDSDLLTDATDSAASRAFARARALTWRGAPIQPFSGRRLIAAQACGLRFMRLAAEASEAQAGAYDGIFWDAVITVYLCQAPASETMRAVRLPNLVTENALAWADRQNLTPQSQEFVELLDLFNQIMTDIMASNTEAQPPVTAGAPVPQKKMQTTTPSTGSPSSPSKSDPSPEETHPTSS